MGFLELFLLGVGLSMDAFAASICQGLKMQELKFWRVAVIGLFFGGFQAMMPLAGWILGTQFEQYIVSIDHWIAFGLLVLIGSKMIIDSLSKEDECKTMRVSSFAGELLLLAVATSIDALAVGVSFAFLKVDIGLAIAVIGATTFVISAIGVWMGNRFGSKHKQKAEIAGGVILCLIGLKILLEHLGIIAF